MDNELFLTVSATCLLHQQVVLEIPHILVATFHNFFSPPFPSGLFALYFSIFFSATFLFCLSIAFNFLCLSSNLCFHTMSATSNQCCEKHFLLVLLLFSNKDQSLFLHENVTHCCSIASRLESS